MKKNVGKRMTKLTAPPKPSQPGPRSTKVLLQAPSKQPVQVKHLSAPPTFRKPRRIHPRRVLPFVREGLERSFHSMSTRAILDPAKDLRALAQTTADDVVLFTNTALSQAGQNQTASNVGEPSAALNGNVVVYTGNWYAAMSSDGGKTFQYIDPASAFAASDPPNSHFCCDQVVNFIPSIDTFVWLLQYGPDTGDNIQRLAFAKSADVVQGRWRLFDITTASLGVQGAFLDFPDLAVGANCLYVTTNIFQGTDQAGSGVVRIPFTGIDSGQIAAQRFVSMDFQSFRVTQNCGATAFFAAHQDTSTLAVFRWDESQPTPTQSSVGVARWIGGNGYQSRCPDGNRWLDRADSRITGATQTGQELWFAWGVDRGSNQRANPFVQIARINAQDLTLIENINIFDPDSATCYAALGTNIQGEVGVSYMAGGGARNPSHVVGILTGARKDVVVSEGVRGPLPDPDTSKGEWGDFLSVRSTFPDRANFSATGYTMLGAADGSNRDATPRFVVFGRSGAAGQPPGAGQPDRGGIGVGPISGPITNVNALPVVGNAVAAKIKQACGITTAPAAPRAMAAESLPEAALKPGVERWPVKTGQDPDRIHVGKNVLNGQDLGAGIVVATVEELISAPRPADMPDPKQLYNAYQSHRAEPVETTIWRLDVTIMAMKLEADGDYHLVLQGASGETMIGEVPTANTQFVGDSPWLANMQDTRRAVEDKFVSHLSPAAFVPFGNKLVPREAISGPLQSLPKMPASFLPPVPGEAQVGPAFKTQVPATRARVTGVGFFDNVHGQMGVSQPNGIELHPMLKIEWL
jgi:hypothetical protein